MASHEPLSRTNLKVVPPPHHHFTATVTPPKSVAGDHDPSHRTATVSQREPSSLFPKSKATVAAETGIPALTLKTSYREPTSVGTMPSATTQPSHIASEKSPRPMLAPSSMGAVSN
ncbi:hypothetical protein V8G54_006299 [Vigna mungo]|uniref:Uncharacterized protein n=1 Tax=Vigna mungo TaxID=3915 RepID=A0AAQ3S6A4_VIGMU